MPDLKELNRISELLKDRKCIAVAYSSGLDSSVLLRLLQEAGKEIIAITVYFPYIPRRAIKRGEEFTRKWGIPHMVLIDKEIMEDGEIARNGLYRCYACKRRMMSMIIRAAEMEGCDLVVDGTNFDDLSEIRPGLRALEELGVISPFAILKVTKERIREMAKELNVPEILPDTCLLTRLPHDFQVNEGLLRRIDLAEEAILGRGVSLVRARYFHGGLRIEVLPDDFQKLVRKGIREALVEELMKLGFDPITLDLKGYTRST